MKVYISTYGCALNQSDSESIAGVLAKEGHDIVLSKDTADIVVINTCTVKGPTEAKIRKELRELESQEKKVVLAGCLSQTKYGQKLYEKYSCVGTNTIDKIGAAVNAANERKVVSFIGEKHSQERISLPTIRTNNLIAIIPINEGCMSACSFCHTKKARGNTTSYSVEDIVARVKNAVNNGAKEIWLTSPDTATWGKDIGKQLPELLRAVLMERGGFKVRLGMGNPDHLLEYIDELLEVMKNERMFKFLHVPVQSGSDAVLKKMLRPYSIANFRTIVEKARKAIPGITIATDIIVGFPSETDEDFELTMRLLHDVQPEVLNMSRFWPRPDTLAAKMKQVPSNAVKERSIRLRNEFFAMAEKNNKKWIGLNGKVTVNETGKNGTFVGRTDSYRPVILASKVPLGSAIIVQVENATPLDLRGKPAEANV
ncbi:MAG: tRNA (N(6)-L-threonylcarbamoyladenosine(37)-C(2))-methylthiotransferase [Candidatus Woesearchaeota archaeon]